MRLLRYALNSCHKVTILLLGASVGLSPQNVLTPQVDIQQALMQHQKVLVIVGFRNLKTPWTDLRTRAAEIAIRNRVLSRISTSDFALTHHWEVVGAMAGYITASGLAKLSRDPEVIYFAGSGNSCEVDSKRASNQG
jgi:hypothetical protein